MKGQSKVEVRRKNKMQSTRKTAVFKGHWSLEYLTDHHWCCIIDVTKENNHS